MKDVRLASQTEKERTLRWRRGLMCFVLAVGAAAPVVTHAQVRVEETASTSVNFTGTASITYVGKWHQTEIVRNWSGGTAAASIWGPADSASPSDPNVPPARVTLSFNGTGVSWIGARGPQLGIAHVFLDGVQQPDVDSYTNVEVGQEQVQAVLFSSGGLAAGPHTLAIEVTGTKNTASSGYIIVVDAFDIQGTPGGRIQEAGPAAITYYGTWIQGDATRPGASGGTLTYSYAELDPGIVQVGGPVSGVTTRAVFTFSGTRVTWIGAKSPLGGTANVYVDGVLVPPEVDSFASTEQLQVPIFTSAVLPAGIHTLAIEVKGAKSAASTCDPATAVSCFSVAVDAFEVPP